MTLNKSYNHDPVLRIVVASTSFAKSSILCDELKRFFPNTHFNNTGKHLSEPELINFLEDADAAIIGTEPITEKILAQTPKLKIISKYGVGLDNIDHTALEKRNITLGWTGGVNRRSVSELTLCFMLGLCRNIFAAGFELKQSRWKKTS